jgi:hypothetical protein
VRRIAQALLTLVVCAAAPDLAAQQPAPRLFESLNWRMIGPFQRRPILNRLLARWEALRTRELAALYQKVKSAGAAEIK